MVRNFVYPPSYAALPGDTAAQAQGKRIRYWRKQKNWTQAQLGKRVGLAASSIATLEQGRQTNSKGLAKIAPILGVDYTHLITGEGDPHTDVQVVEVIATDGELPISPDLIKRLNRLDPNDQRLAALEIEAIVTRIESVRRERSRKA